MTPSTEARRAVSELVTAAQRAERAGPMPGQGERWPAIARLERMEKAEALNDARDRFVAVARGLGGSATDAARHARNLIHPPSGLHSVRQSIADALDWMASLERRAAA